MFGWTKKEKDDKTELELETEQHEQIQPKDKPNEVEQETVAKVEADYWTARSAREDNQYDLDLSVEDEWEDEYYLFKGGGLQWMTNFAYRSKRARRLRLNSEDNFIFNTITIQHANVTADTPEICVYGVEQDDQEISKKLTDVLRFNDNRNDFSKMWKRWVYDFLGSGPTIAMVTWDSDWYGGRGPERWMGDIRMQRVDKWDIYFDPAITDLEEDLQECSYIIRRPRKKLKYIRDRWEKGKYVGESTIEDEYINEGADPKQAYVIEYWHRGYPWFVDDENRKRLNERAIELEQNGEPYRANDYYDAAKGDLEGIHVAYVADGILLEYRPYEYEHGEYPFVFTTRYSDDKGQWGFGEIRNIKIPQVLHNKADEIEMEAMAREGLGGKYYQKGAVNPKQIDKILTNSGKGGMWFEVDNVGLIQDRTGTRTPASLTNYKEHKQRMIETVSSNTPIQQGLAPSASTPFAAIQELGARSDVRMKAISNKLEDFLKKIAELRIELIAQFYTEERYYRIRGTDGKIDSGTITNEDLMSEWTRETEVTETVDTETGQVLSVETLEKKEKFIPEFDVVVTVVSQKPKGREYYTNLAMQLYQMQLITPEDLFETLEDGKLPPMKEVLERVYARQPIMGIMNQIQELPEEVQGQVNQQVQQAIQQIVMGAMQQQQV